MNEYKRFIQNELDRRNWNPADVTNNGGPSRQVMSNILNDNREILVQRPRQETIEALSRAFGIRVEVILAHVAKAMGLPVHVEAQHLDDVSDDDLLDQIRKRMQRGSSQHAEDNEEDPNASTTPEQAPPTNLRSISSDYHAEDSKLEQKTELPDLEHLAAHHDFETDKGRFEKAYGAVGEESQDPEDG